MQATFLIVFSERAQTSELSVFVHSYKYTIELIGSWKNGTLSPYAAGITVETSAQAISAAVPATQLKLLMEDSPTRVPRLLPTEDPPPTEAGNIAGFLPQQ